MPPAASHARIASNGRSRLPGASRLYPIASAITGGAWAVSRASVARSAASTPSWRPFSSRHNSADTLGPMFDPATVRIAIIYRNLALQSKRVPEPGCSP